MAEVLKFDFGEETQFFTGARIATIEFLRGKLIEIGLQILKLESPDGSGVEEAIEEIKKLQNGVSFLRQIASDVDPKDIRYEVPYVDKEVFGQDQRKVLEIAGGEGVLAQVVNNSRALNLNPLDLDMIKANLAIYSLNDNFLAIPMIGLISSNYGIGQFDAKLVEESKQLFSALTPVQISNLEVASKTKRGLELSYILDKFGQDLNADSVTFPSDSFKNDLTAENVDSVLGGSFINSEFKFDPETTTGGWIQSLFSFFSARQEELSMSAKVRTSYLRFIKEVIRDDEDVLFAPNETSLQQKFNQTISDVVNDPMVVDDGKLDLNQSGFYSLLARDIENKRRLRLINAPQVDQDQLEAAGVDSAKEYLEKQQIAEMAGESFGGEADTQLSEEDIKNRQRFFKQCALMMNMPRLADAFVKIIQDRRVKKANNRQNTTGTTTNTCGTLVGQFNNLPFDGRLYMVSNTDDQSATLSKMLNSNVAAELFNIPPAVLSSLVPKIKLYRVQSTDEGTQKTEFVFDSTEDLDRKRNYTEKYVNFLDMPFDKGSGVGLKNFTFEFNGTNPAESRKDIKATLTMHFQSFDDFIAERKSYNGQKYRFVDLVLHPKKEDDNIIYRNQYSPSYYRIMAEVGYHIPNKELKKMFPSYTGADNLIESLVRTNKVFYLCMIDHDFQINTNGTVDLTISYGAYVETILKTHQYDALATPEIIEQRKQNLLNYIEVVESKQCSQDQLQRILAGLDAQEDVIRQRALKSIIQRLVERNKIFVCEISETQAVGFRTNGFFKDKPVLRGLKSQRKEVTAEDAIKQGQETGVTKTILSQVYLPEDYNYNSPQDNTIQYFYFGDLLHTILDTMYKIDNPSSLKEEIENCKFILGSFDFGGVYNGGGNSNSTVNIAQIPISVEYFADWFQNNVLKKGETRKSFPVITFIRNLSSNLLQQSLLESCINRRIDKNFSFQTGQLTAYNKGGDPLRPIHDDVNSKPVIEIDTYRGKGTDVFPFKGDTTSEMKDIRNYHNFMYLGVLGSSLSTKGKGNYTEDNNNGMYHIEIGNNKGIVKSVSFAKTDMQFVREARFFQQGIDGLLQLSTVYKVTIEMFGNTIFYPGMDLYLNPYGIGGNKLGSPTQGLGSPTQGGVGGNQERSLANKLGLGGYHTVTSVRSSIGVGGFNTTIEAQMYYSGDGSTAYVQNGKATGTAVKNLTGSLPPAKSQKGTPQCENVVAAVESDLSLLEKNQATKYFSSITAVNQSANNVQNSAASATPATPAPQTANAGSAVVPNAQAAAQAAVVQNQTAAPTAPQGSQPSETPSTSPTPSTTPTSGAQPTAPPATPPAPVAPTVQGVDVNLNPVNISPEDAQKLYRGEELDYIPNFIVIHAEQPADSAMDIYQSLKEEAEFVIFEETGETIINTISGLRLLGQFEEGPMIVAYSAFTIGNVS